MEDPRPEFQATTPQEVYDQNHAELLEYMGWLSATLASNYRNERPRSPEHIGKQEELLAMLQAVLEFARM